MVLYKCVIKIFSSKRNRIRAIPDSKAQLFYEVHHHPKSMKKPLFTPYTILELDIEFEKDQDFYMYMFGGLGIEDLHEELMKCIKQALIIKYSHRPGFWRQFIHKDFTILKIYNYYKCKDKNALGDLLLKENYLDESL